MSRTITFTQPTTLYVDLDPTELRNIAISSDEVKEGRWVVRDGPYFRPPQKSDFETMHDDHFIKFVVVKKPFRDGTTVIEQRHCRLRSIETLSERVISTWSAWAVRRTDACTVSIETISDIIAEAHEFMERHKSSSFLKEQVSTSVDTIKTNNTRTRLREAASSIRQILTVDDSLRLCSRYNEYKASIECLRSAAARSPDSELLFDKLDDIVSSVDTLSDAHKALSASLKRTHSILSDVTRQSEI